jgi:sugar/nucleoside kinase (ribokinase family)
VARLPWTFVPRSHPFTAHIPALTNKEGIRYDVVGVGNALVDMIAMVDDSFLGSHDMVKGSMALIETDRAVMLSEAIGDATRVGGGSGANTIAGIASLGGEVAFVGKVANDELGRAYAADMVDIGVDFHSGGPDSSTPTGRCIIAVTPDAQRTMNTYLGISTQLAFDDVDDALVASGAILYLEGYLFDRDEAKDAFRRAAALAHSHGRVVALTLSDSFCVDRHRADFLALVRDEIDLLFANEDELKSLYETVDFDEAVNLLRRDCHIAAVTRSEKGSVVVTRDDVHAVPALPVKQVVDTTGAGDLYAAGFLRGLTQGKDLTSCARIGAIAAAEVISHVGPRPLVPLIDLLPADLK